MRKVVWTIGIVVCGLLAAACHNDGDSYYYHELEKIDHRTNRDLARQELAALKGETEHCSDYVRYYYLLQALVCRNAWPKS